MRYTDETDSSDQMDEFRRKLNAIVNDGRDDDDGDKEGFVGQLHRYAEEYHEKAADVLTKSEFIDIKIGQYTNYIRELCEKRARGGGRSLRGFFVPQYIDYNYETTVEGPRVIDEPISHMHDRPSKNPLYGGMMGGNLDLREAAINLFDGERYSKPIKFTVDAEMIEQVRAGIVRRLADPGFRKFEIKHLTGEIFGLQKLIFSEAVSAVGTAHYYYLDIEW